MLIEYTIIESPYAGNIERNEEYLYRAMQDSINRGEIPFASHGFFPRYLDEDKPQERKLGIELGNYIGVAMIDAANFPRTESMSVRIAVYIDYGLTEGMKASIERYTNHGKVTVLFRKIGEN